MLYRSCSVMSQDDYNLKALYGYYKLFFVGGENNDETAITKSKWYPKVNKLLLKVKLHIVCCSGMGRRQPWGSVPTASSAIERRRKSNFELRKIILPKAPVTVLNEILATGNPVEYSFLEPYFNGTSYVFYAECEVSLSLRIVI